MQSQGLKSVRIGQSAAKLPSGKNVQRLSRSGEYPSSDGEMMSTLLAIEGEDIVCSLMKVRAGVQAHRVSVTTLLDNKHDASRSPC